MLVDTILNSDSYNSENLESVTSEPRFNQRRGSHRFIDQPEDIQEHVFSYPPEAGRESERDSAPPLDSPLSAFLFSGAESSVALPPDRGNPPKLLPKRNRHQDYLRYVHYTSNQIELYPNLLTPVEECKTKYLVSSCECGRHILPQGCEHLACVTCADFLGFRRARSALRRIMKYQPNYPYTNIKSTVIYTVFTLPMELREHYADPKNMRKLRGRLWNILKTFFGGLFALEATHPISEEHVERFHPHMNFLWVQRKGFRPYLSVDALRAMYSKILLDFPGEVDIYTTYSNDTPQIWKWCQYVTRVFPSYSEWCGPVKWFGKYPKSDQKDTFQCGECGQVKKVLGYCDSYKIESYERHGWKIGLDPPWDNDENITFFKSAKAVDHCVN